MRGLVRDQVLINVTVDLETDSSRTGNRNMVPKFSLLIGASNENGKSLA